MTVPVSGEQFTVRFGGYEAVVTSIGASLRMLQHEGRNLVVPFEAEEMRPYFRGATLVPWPNRIVDGRYTFAGEPQQLVLTEPSRLHALHGLVSWLRFEPVDVTETSVTLAADIEPQQGYPHRIGLSVSYALDADGLTISVRAHNRGSGPAPYGASIHPYLTTGSGRVDDWRLELPAHDVFTTEGPRLLPGRVVPIAEGDDFDFTERRPIGAIALDHAFTNIDRVDGLAHVTVTGADGLGVRMTWDEECDWVQIHTADLPDRTANRIGLAVEPMTCAPDAFNNERGLIVLDANGQTTTSWRISAIVGV